MYFLQLTLLVLSGYIALSSATWPLKKLPLVPTWMKSSGSAEVNSKNLDVNEAKMCWSPLVKHLAIDWNVDILEDGTVTFLKQKSIRDLIILGLSYNQATDLYAKLHADSESSVVKQSEGFGVDVNKETGLNIKGTKNPQKWSVSYNKQLGTTEHGSGGVNTQFKVTDASDTVTKWQHSDQSGSNQQSQNIRASDTGNGKWGIYGQESLSSETDNIRQSSNVIKVKLGASEQTRSHATITHYSNNDQQSYTDKLGNTEKLSSSSTGGGKWGISLSNTGNTANTDNLGSHVSSNDNKHGSISGGGKWGISGQNSYGGKLNSQLGATGEIGSHVSSGEQFSNYNQHESSTSSEKWSIPSHFGSQGTGSNQFSSSNQVQASSTGQHNSHGQWGASGQIGSQESSNSHVTTSSTGVTGQFGSHVSSGTQSSNANQHGSGQWGVSGLFGSQGSSNSHLTGSNQQSNTGNSHLGATGLLGSHVSSGTQSSNTNQQGGSQLGVSGLFGSQGSSNSHLTGSNQQSNTGNSHLGATGQLGSHVSSGTHSSNTNQHGGGQWGLSGQFGSQGSSNSNVVDSNQQSSTGGGHLGGTGQFSSHVSSGIQQSNTNQQGGPFGASGQFSSHVSNSNQDSNTGNSQLEFNSQSSESGSWGITEQSAFHGLASEESNKHETSSHPTGLFGSGVSGLVGNIGLHSSHNGNSQFGISKETSIDSQTSNSQKVGVRGDIDSAFSNKQHTGTETGGQFEGTDHLESNKQSYGGNSNFGVSGHLGISKGFNFGSASNLRGDEQVKETVKPSYTGGYSFNSNSQVESSSSDNVNPKPSESAFNYESSAHLNAKPSYSTGIEEQSHASFDNKAQVSKEGNLGFNENVGSKTGSAFGFGVSKGFDLNINKQVNAKPSYSAGIEDQSHAGFDNKAQVSKESNLGFNENVGSKTGSAFGFGVSKGFDLNINKHVNAKPSYSAGIEEQSHAGFDNKAQVSKEGNLEFNENVGSKTGSGFGFGVSKGFDLNVNKGSGKQDSGFSLGLNKGFGFNLGIPKLFGGKYESEGGISIGSRSLS